MTLTQEQVYLTVIGILMVMQISQWYYIVNLRRQMQSVWMQIVTIALMLSAKDMQKNEQQENKN